MTLRGHTDELSLADLIQVTAQSRRTCHIRMTALSVGSDAFIEGDLYFDNGEPVFASFGSLEGAAAVHAAVNVENIIYRVDASSRAPRTNLSAGWEEVLLEAARLRDEGRVPVARPAPRPASQAASAETVLSAAPAPAPAAVPAELRPVSTAVAAAKAAPPPAAAPGRRFGLLAAVAIALVALGLGALYAAGTRHREPAAPVSAGLDAAAIDAGALTGPGDRPPELLSGAAPESPDPTLGLRPTVVCRVLVDVNGAVQSPSVYRPRAELAAFEAVALDAVRTYRFRPAERGGKPVAAWVNWPVSFR
jgi:TonB family protein